LFPFTESEKRYYNLLIFLAAGTRIPRGIIRFLSGNKTLFTGILPAAVFIVFTIADMLYKKSTGSKTKRTIPLPGAIVWPYAIENANDGKSFFVSNYILGPYVQKITMSESPDILTRMNGFFNLGMCTSSNGDKLFVARPLHRRINVLDSQTLEEIGQIESSFGVRELVCSGNIVVALNFLKGTATLYNQSTGDVVDEIQAGGAGRAIAIDKKRKMLYIGTSKGVFYTPAPWAGN
jgi:hypothetical protein